MKLKRQQEELAAEEIRLRESAAANLGKVLLEGDAETLAPAQFRQLIRLATTL